ncbi:hypothetical protein HMF7854_03525 [Sphingomonas ginkgonis]|uniref:Acetolactate synthase n=1 Tax=Sphingomonas ginkgonis TaxID=2315330 RepID=A0A429V7Q4_9SPHN|nr:hypothetical protein [Sphingomonas ginkgonis]RST30001.1 hypothetical protein HMF7854_03525 [Sphingomonas ginkgonis]
MASLTIDFQPGEQTVPQILDCVGRHGCYIRSIRVIPTFARHASTLHLNLGGPSDPFHYMPLLGELESMDEIMGRIDMRPTEAGAAV